MHKLKYLTISIILLLLLSVVGPSFDVAAAPLGVATAPPLGAAASFSVLAALSMSAAAAGTTVSGDLGLSPGVASSRTGPWTVGGSEYFGTGGLSQDAQTDALIAFNNMAGQPSDGAPSGFNIPPGVWTAASDITLTGAFTLTGLSTDVWVFQIGRDMTFSGSVVMAGTAQACNVYWQIGRSATIGSGSAFVGTLIASSDITLVSGATVDGRLMSLNSSLTTDGNNIFNSPCLAPTATPTNTPTATLGPGTPSVTPGPGTPSVTPLPGPGTPSATPRPFVGGLPNTGGAPIREEFPWSLVIVAGLSAMALGLGVRSYRRKHLPKQ